MMTEAATFRHERGQSDICYGLWYPIAIAAMTLVIGLIFIRETKGTDLNAIK